MSETWEAAQSIRDWHGMSKPGFDATDADVSSIAQQQARWLLRNGAAYLGEVRGGTHLWKTAQLEDGRIVGCQGETVLAAQLSIEVWWGSPVVWIVPDGSSRVHDRYLGEVSTAATRSREARTFPVTAGPLEYPTRDGVATAVQGEFDFEGLL
ncbi:hypothetical protein ACXR2T_10705 [Leucobacter sp. HY1910]